MTIFRKSSELWYRGLKIDDMVIFTLPSGEKLNYRVMTNINGYFLDRETNNDLIFYKMGLDKISVCNGTYTHQSDWTGSDWPEAKTLTDLKFCVLYLYEKIELKCGELKCGKEEEPVETIKKFETYRVYSRKTDKKKPKPIDIRNIDGQIQIKRKDGSATLTFSSDMLDDIITALKMLKEDQ